MDYVLYQKLIVPCRESEDGDTPTHVFVTEENNGYGVFTYGFNGQELLKWFSRHERDEAIEYGVNHADEMLIAKALKQAA
jgi:hypothetical protein